MNAVTYLVVFGTLAAGLLAVLAALAIRTSERGQRERARARIADLAGLVDSEVLKRILEKRRVDSHDVEQITEHLAEQTRESEADVQSITASWKRIVMREHEVWGEQLAEMSDEHRYLVLRDTLLDLLDDLPLEAVLLDPHNRRALDESLAKLLPPPPESRERAAPRPSRP